MQAAGRLASQQANRQRSNITELSNGAQRKSKKFEESSPDQTYELKIDVFTSLHLGERAELRTGFEHPASCSLVPAAGRLCARAEPPMTLHLASDSLLICSYQHLPTPGVLSDSTCRRRRTTSERTRGPLERASLRFDFENTTISLIIFISLLDKLDALCTMRSAIAESQALPGALRYLFGACEEPPCWLLTGRL